MSFKKILAFLIFLLTVIVLLFYFTYKKPKLLTVNSPRGNFSAEVYSSSPWYLNQDQYHIRINDSIQDTTLVSFITTGDTMQVQKILWSKDERLLGILFANSRLMVYDVFMETFILDRYLFPKEMNCNKLTRFTFTSKGDSLSFEFLKEDNSPQQIKLPLFPSGK